MSSAAIVAVYQAGGVLNDTDTILCGVFIALFTLVGIHFHLRLYRAYNRRFIYSSLCFTFCMARTIALAFRIAVVKEPTNKTLTIISQVIIAAGVAFIYAVLLQMSRRFFGQLYPEHALAVKRVVGVTCWVLVPIIILAVVAIVESYTSTNPDVISNSRKIRQAVSIVLSFIAFLPTSIVILLLSVRPHQLTSPSSVEYELDPEDAQPISEPMTTARPSTELAESRESVEDQPQRNSTSVPADLEKQSPAKTRVKGEPLSGFGQRPVTRTDVIETALCIVVPSLLFTWEQGIRTAQAFYTINVQSPPPWYMSKATFWVSIFGVEWIAVVVLGLAVLPRRFSHLQLV